MPTVTNKAKQKTIKEQSTTDSKKSEKLIVSGSKSLNAHISTQEKDQREDKAAKPTLTAAQETAKKDAVRKDKLQAVDVALAQIEKQFGKGAIMKFDEREKLAVESIPTGSLSLDLALGVGGIPKGRVVEVFGPESSGKTTLASHMIAEVQKKGGVAAFIDAEHAFDPEYAKNLGINVDDLLISQPDTGEQALDIVETLVRSNGVDIIVIDSVAALTPRAELEGDMGDSHMGLHARLMSQALRKLTGAISRSNATIIFINQIRMKIGVMFGNPETTTGGNALKFYSSLRLDVRRVAQLKDGEAIIGNRTKVKVVKNKVAPPFKVAEFDIMYGKGISREGDLLDLAAEREIIAKSGAWYEYEGSKLGQGREQAKQFLLENPKVAKEVEAKIRKHVES
ncbi:recombinase RecA [Patescibacteria group bacterium]|nr:recombinase RecA [Patescibacteria group bacterium]